ncbi:MAG: type II secretion system protein GspD [Opitutales bacterium]
MVGVLNGQEGDGAPETETPEIPLYELPSKRIRLSYINPNRCLQLLKMFGFNVGKPGEAVKRQDLPMIIALPPTESYDTVGDGLKQPFPMTEADPIFELMVFYLPDQLNTVGKLINLIEDTIDVPARQIMIEAMILEINETALNRLGVEWKLIPDEMDRLQEVQLGNVVSDADGIPDTLAFGFVDLFGTFEVELRALVSNGDAEILSRPSVLTLDNRMAYINVSEEIPIASSKFSGNGNVQTVDFNEKTVGIQLAVRPRISSKGDEVSLQVNAAVSSRVPSEDVEVTNQDGDVVARAPTIAIREVRTYARIHNNTPFIIGGLVAKDDLKSVDSVPILGEIPLLGKLFSTEETVRQKREVIIVLTPSVLREGGNTNIGKNLPKGEDRFDSSGNELFRDTYRIRESDTFDLHFLTESLGLRRLRALADAAVQNDLDRADEYPFELFANGSLPGERVLVYRQVYEVLNRIGLAEKLHASRMIFFGGSPDISGDFNLSILDDYIISVAREHGYNRNQDPLFYRKGEPKLTEAVWDALEGKALVFTFTDSSAAGEARVFQPEAQISVVDIDSREAYRELQWELNQPTEEGYPRSSVILRNEHDLQRLKNAVLLRQTIQLNGSGEELLLKEFNVGRLLMLPTRNEQEFDLIDREVARLDFFIDRYYDVLRHELSKAADALEASL